LPPLDQVVAAPKDPFFFLGESREVKKK